MTVCYYPKSLDISFQTCFAYVESRSTPDHFRGQIRKLMSTRSLAQRRRHERERAARTVPWNQELTNFLAVETDGNPQTVAHRQLISSKAVWSRV